MGHIRGLIAVLAVALLVLGTAAWSASSGMRGGDSPVARPSVAVTDAPSPDGVATEASGVAALGPRSPAARSDASASPRSTAPAADANTAAARYGWSKLVVRDDFTGSSLHPSWGPYDSVGNGGQGIRSPRQISLSGGVLRMTGAPDGTTAGMTWSHPQKYGRWEVRARFPAGCGCYHPVLILWPVDHPWPAGGEVDYAEVFDGERQKLNFFLHYGADNRQHWAGKHVDMTRWHNYAVEWTPNHIVGFVDGQPFFRNAQRETHPPGRMNQTVQLDWFPDGTSGGGALELDWATIYRL